MNVAVVSPIFREAANLPEFCRRVAAALQGHEYRIILVDDNSKDGTWGFVLQHPEYPIVLYTRLDERGYGSAMIKGIVAAADYDPDYLITMDADLQEPPELIPQLLAEGRLGNDLVIGVKDSRRLNDTFERRLATRTARWLARHIARVPASDVTSDYRLYSRKAHRYLIAVIKNANYYPNDDLLNLYILKRLYSNEFKWSEVTYYFSPRFLGKTKKTARKRLKQYIRYFVYVFTGIF